MKETETQKELSLEEKWEQSGLENGFIFYNIMRTYPEICKRLLEILLQIEIDKIEINQEETISVDHDSKGIRIDLFLKNDTQIFDVEMQVKDTHELPERSRYYQALMDVDSLKANQKYKNMKTSHVIFICMTDIFHEGLAVYHFENRCVDNLQISLGDRAFKHFFIAENYDKIKDEEQKAFLSFLFNKVATNSYTNELNQCVTIAKHNSQWRHWYMDWVRDLLYERDEAREEGFAEGRAEGSQQTRLETAKNFLKMNFEPEQIAQGTGLTLEEVLEIKQSVMIEQ